MRMAAPAGTMNPIRNDPDHVETRPVSQGRAAPPIAAMEKTHPLLRQASSEFDAKDNIRGNIGANPIAVIEAPASTCRLDLAASRNMFPASRNPTPPA